MFDQIAAVQALLHDYLAPHTPPWPHDLDDERGCAGCRMIAQHLVIHGVTVTPITHEVAS